MKNHIHLCVIYIVFMITYDVIVTGYIQYEYVGPVIAPILLSTELNITVPYSCVCVCGDT